MVNRQSLISNIDELLLLIRTRSNSWFSLLFLPPSLAERVSQFSAQCIDLKKKALAAEDNSDEFFELTKEYLDLEIWAKRRVAKNNLIPTALGLYTVFCALFLVIKWVDFTGIISKTLGVEAPERLITLGVAGAFVYLATSIMTKIAAAEGDKQINSIIDFSIRVLLAIVVPIILVALFFKHDGTINNLELSPDLISFSCGYSAKLVVDIFNKIVEKASKMISAI